GPHFLLQGAASDRSPGRAGLGLGGGPVHHGGGPDRVPRGSGIPDRVGRVADVLRARHRGATRLEERAMRRWTETRGSISARGLVPFLDTLFNLLFALLAIHAAHTANSSEFLRLRLPRVEPGEEERLPASAGIAVAVDADGSIRMAGTELV